MNHFKNKKTRWERVENLQAGVKIAVADTDKGEMFWDEVVEIKKVGREEVYDIEVEGTRNFVGNNIIAHNTYISGNLGIGTTNPLQKLEVNGILRVKALIEPHGQSPWYLLQRPVGANIPHQSTNSPTGKTRGTLGAGIEVAAEIKFDWFIVGN